MQITFLGTTAMVPTKDRNHFSFFLSYKNEGIMFDCGEGTQRQLKIAKIRPSKITRIIISHFHGDHVLGLPGLFQTLSASDYDGTLHVYGPPGMKEFIRKMMDVFIYDNQLNFQVHEIKKKKFLDLQDFYIEAFELDHRIPCLGFRFSEKDSLRINMKKAEKLGLKQGPKIGMLQNNQEITHNGKKIKPSDVATLQRGRVIGYIADTIMCNSCLDIAKDADLLIAESTHTSKHEDKSIQYKHFNAKQAAYVAHQANAKKLILTHFSQRYKNINEVLDDAKDVFPETIASFDFMKVKV